MVNGHNSFRSDQIEIRHIPAIRSRLLRVMLSPLLFYIYALRQKACLYHLHDPELLPAGFLLKISGRKVLYDAHENTPMQLQEKYYLPPFFRKLLSRLVRLFEDLAARFFDGVVAATSGVKDDYPRGVQNKIILLRNYPDIREFSDLTAALTERAVCYVGALTRSRGLETMVDSLPHHGARLELAGYAYPSNLLEQVGEGVDKSRIHYHGVTDRKGVGEIFRNSSAGLVVLPDNRRHSLALPIKMFEYMAAGLPVIASNIPLWREIVEGHECGLCIEPDNPALLGETIEKLLNDEALRRRMGENGRKAVAQMYNWKNEEHVLFDLYVKMTR
jgi:glycosyltransferase involved in cell wall biosynthesis